MNFLHSLRLLCVFVTMATCVLGNTTRTSALCGDQWGFTCLFSSNTNEYIDVPIHFDKPLPTWLNGTLIRNGLGLFERGKQAMTHVFDGFAKLSSWKFQPNGSTLFTSRFIRSSFYNETMKQDHLAPFLLFNPPVPPFNPVEIKESLLNGLDNMNINIWDFPENSVEPDFAAFSDYWNVYHVSGKDLSTRRLVKPRLTGGDALGHLDLLSSGHPLPEPGTTNRLTYLIGQKVVGFMSNRLMLVRMSSVTDRSLIAEWEVKDDIPYMHSFSVTQTKAIMATGPVVANTKCLFGKGAVLPCMEWFGDMRSVLYIADLKTGKKQTINMTSSIFAIHHINAYEVTSDKIVMDVVCYDTEDALSKMLLLDTVLHKEKRDTAYVRPMVRRIFIDLSARTAEIQDMSTNNLVTDGLDMPAINENYRARKYCYVYGMNNFADGKNMSASAIVKKDMCNGGKVVGKLFNLHHYPVEPAFVPNPHGQSEDDGVLLVPILRGEDALTYLAVVDAKTMTIISKADTPDYVPFSLHGRFFQGFH